MKIRVPYYFKDFKCVASECSDTCCAGWEITIDDKTFNKYKKVKGDFGKQLNSKITFYEDNEPGFILDNNNCPFLNKNLLCNIYSNLGEDHLCHTCKTFPRIIEEYGSLREICLSLSCPEAARLILKDHRKVSFETSENDEFVTTYNSISPELYLHIIKCRKIAFDLLQNEDIDFNKRLALLLKFSSDIQEKIDLCELSQIATVRKNYLDSNFINNLIDSFDNYNNKQDIKYNIMHKYMNVFENLEEINEIWPKIIANAINVFYTKNNLEFYETSHTKFKEYYKNKLYEYENLIVYFINRYFMRCLLDADLLSKIKLGIMSLLIIKDLNVVSWLDNNYNFNLKDQIEISHMYSKEVEHSDNNIEKLHQLFNENPMYDLDTMISLIMN